MDHHLSIQISDSLDGFVQNQVGSGRYDSADAVVADALELLREYEQKAEALRLALIAGEESGPPTPLIMSDIINKARAKAGYPPRDA